MLHVINYGSEGVNKGGNLTIVLEYEPVEHGTLQW